MLNYEFMMLDLDPILVTLFLPDCQGRAVFYALNLYIYLYLSLLPRLFQTA